MNEQDPIIINELVYKSLDNTISQAECDRLNAYVKSDPEAAAYYVRMVRLHWGLKRTIRLYQLPTPTFPDQFFNDITMEELAAYEKIAPSICIQESDCPPVPAVLTPYPHQPVRPRRKISKSTVFSLVVSVAAMLFVALFLHFAPVRPGVEVATLADSLYAKWDSSGLKLENGTRFVTGPDKWMIREGLAELLFDNNTRVVVEGPAEFEILTADQIRLNYGKLYAAVPPQAYGFTVGTATSRIIDLGTEFGISAGLDGDVEVHVTKGKVNFLSGLQEKRFNATIEEGAGKILDAATAELRDTACDELRFARDLNSDMAIVWRGQKTIDLADIVGGGSGFGTGRRGSSINAQTGRWQANSPIVNQLGSQNPETTEDTKTCVYAPVPSHAFVDGVFVPDGEHGPVRVSSLGHRCDQVPDTTGTNWGGIMHADRVLRKQIVLNDVRYGTADRSALFMHANGGVTFDLERIRQAMSGRNLSAFTSVYGISDTYPDVVRPPCADFWVLVDGRVRFVKRNVRVHQGGTIDIPLTDTDRFLTLMTTDAGETTQGEGRARVSFNDWCIFGEPKLSIQ